MITKIFLQALLFSVLITPSPIQETPITAEITTDCKIYSDKYLNFPVGELFTGQFAEILEDYSTEIYKVYDSTQNVTGWLAAEYLIIPPDEPADKSILTRTDLESFANDNNYASHTNFLIITDINRQKTHIFIKKLDGWRLVRTFDCSTGINASPTTRGIFIISDRGTWFYSDRLAAGAKYWLRFNGQYLFHSIPMDKHKKIIPGEDIVGEKRSGGCIRLMPDEAKWLFENIPAGTTAVII
jgi:lipoprotein-anchoring transpeptidase ErfK/SrfK